MEYALSELFTLQMGKTPSRDNSSYWEKSENSWISIADLTNSGKYISNTKETLSDSAVAESGIKKIPANTVIMSFKLSLGKVAITEKEMYSNEAIMAFIDKGVEKISPEYLYYLLRAKDWSKGTNKAVMGATLNKATLSTTKIQLHEYDNQLEIVNMLNRVSSSIELRQQQLTKLDELVKARFVEMFGDYPENEKNYSVVDVSEVANVGVGVVIKPAQYYVEAGNGIKAFRSLNIGEMYIKDSDWVYFSQEGNEKNKKSQLHENDLLIIRSGAPGTACVVTKKFEGCNAVDVIIVRPNINKVNPWYLCAYTNYPHGKRQIKEGTGGAAQQHFNVGKYIKMKLMLPPLSLQNQFAAFVEEVDKSKVEVQKALDQTQLLFDSLMQQYFG